MIYSLQTYFLQIPPKYHKNHVMCTPKTTRAFSKFTKICYECMLNNSLVVIQDGILDTFTFQRLCKLIFNVLISSKHYHLLFSLLNILENMKPQLNLRVCLPHSRGNPFTKAEPKVSENPHLRKTSSQMRQLLGAGKTMLGAKQH